MYIMSDFKVTYYKGYKFKCFLNGDVFVWSRNNWSQCLRKLNNSNTSYYRHYDQSSKMTELKHFEYCALAPGN